DHQSRHEAVAIRPDAVVEQRIVARGRDVIGIETGEEGRRVRSLDPISRATGLLDGDADQLEAGVQNVRRGVQPPQIIRAAVEVCLSVQNVEFHGLRGKGMSVSTLAALSAVPFSACLSAVVFSRNPIKPRLVFSGFLRLLNSPRSSSFAVKVFSEPTHSSRWSAHGFQLLKSAVLVSQALGSRMQHSSSHSPITSSLSRQASVASLTDCGGLITLSCHASQSSI